DYEQQCKFLATLINNLKCDVEKSNEANHEAQQANALLSNELEKYKEKEKHFANDKTIESEYCKKIKLLNDEISNLKAQACEKDKTFAMENENYDEFVKPLLNNKNELEKKNQGFLKQINDLDNRLQKVGQTDQTLRMLLPKDGNFEEPPKVYVKRRNVNLKKHLEQAELRNYDPTLWESLPMKYFCYVKHAMHRFENKIVSKQNPPPENVFTNVGFENDTKRISRNRLSNEFKLVVKNVNLQLSCFEKSLVKEMKDHLKYVMSLEDEFDETCLILDIQQDFFKTQFELVKSESYSHVYKNEMFEQNSTLENENSYKKCNKVFQKIELMKKKRVDTQKSNDFLQKSMYDSDSSNVESKSGEKKNIFKNETSSFETKIKGLEMTLAQQTKDFEDAKLDFSKKTDKFETYFEKLKKTKVVLECQLDHKIQDSNTKKNQFLKQIASLESNLASQYLISNQKEYSDLRTLYNALKVKFDSLNRDKGKSPISNYSAPKVSVSSKKIYTGESSNLSKKKVSQFKTYSLQKDRKFSKKPQGFETPTSQKAFKSADSSKKKHIFKTPKSHSTPKRQVWRPKQSHSKPFKYSKS
ncbi:hypothetical protein Tco_0053900, partial [Tanacetum coccineum]